MTDFRHNDKFRDSYNIFTISLDNSTGDARKELLSFDTEIFEACTYDTAPDFIKDRMAFYKIDGKVLRSERGQHGVIGTFGSHYLLLKKIIAEQIDMVLVTEDDAYQKNKLPDPDILDKNSATLYGCLMFHPKSYAKQSKWIREEMHEVIFTLNNGINDIDYSLYRWRGAYSYVIPRWQVAKEIVVNIENSKRYKAIDDFLANNRLINKLHYPAIFENNRNISSQIQSNKALHQALRSML